MIKKTEELSKRLDAANDSMEELRKRLDYISDRIDNPYKSSNATREFIKELELDWQIIWDEPRWGIYATSKQAKSVMDGFKWDEQEEIDKKAKRFFRKAFAESKAFGGIEYDEIKFRMPYNIDKPKMCFDIVLINKTSIAIIEIKNGISPSFVQEFAGERIEEFRRAFPKFKKHKIHLGIAGFLFSKRVQEKAVECGVSIIKREGVLK